MNYVFWGTPEFARIVLAALIDAGHSPAALVTNPDRPAGRKQILTSPPTKELVRLRAPQASIFQPSKARDIIPDLRALAPDLFIVAAYANIIPDEVLSIPRLGTVGVHPSLLPKYRGASPIQTAILEGDTDTGVTLYMLDRDVDHGPIIAQETLAIGTDHYRDLMPKLAALGGSLLARTFARIQEGTLVPQEQRHADALSLIHI